MGGVRVCACVCEYSDGCGLRLKRTYQLDLPHDLLADKVG